MLVFQKICGNKMLLCRSSTISEQIFPNTSSSLQINMKLIKTSTIKSMATDRSSEKRKISADEARMSLVLALASQTSSLSQRLVMNLVNESAKYLFPRRRFESSNLEEALMSVPDLETVKFTVLSKTGQYEIRQVEVEMRGTGSIGEISEIRAMYANLHTSEDKSSTLSLNKNAFKNIRPAEYAV